MAARSTAGYGLERAASTLGQRADELDTRRQHSDTDVLPHAFGLSFELGPRSPYECCPCGVLRASSTPGMSTSSRHCDQVLHHVGEAHVIFQVMQVTSGSRLSRPLQRMHELPQRRLRIALPYCLPRGR
jgi:hypothetical protein